MEIVKNQYTEQGSKNFIEIFNSPPLPLILTVTFLFFSVNLHSQSIYERLTLPPAGFSSGSEPFLLPWNPSAMTLSSGIEATYLHTQLESQSIVPGTGDCVFITSPVFGPVFLGMGFEQVRPPSKWKQGRAKAGNWSMLTFGAGVKLKDVAGLGGNLRAYISDDNPRFDEILTWDMALHLHPSPFMALFLGVYDISTPHIYLPDENPPVNESIERTWVVGVSFRPLGRDTLTLSIDNLIGEVSNNDILRLFLEFKPLRGVAINGLMEMWFGNSKPMSPERNVEYQASIGLKIEFSHFAIFGATHLANRIEDEVATAPYLGFTAGVSISSQYYNTLIARKKYVKLELNGRADSQQQVALLLKMDRIGAEPSVSGIILEMKGFRTSPGYSQDLIEAIKIVRSSGKKVFCLDSEATTSSAYICSYADGYYLNPAGGMWLAGRRMKLVYYAQLLKRLGVNVQIVRIGKYKSFPEKLTLTGPSPESLEQHREVLKDIFDTMVADIGRGRKIAGGYEKTKEIVLRGPFNADEAVEAGLADGTIYGDEIKKTIEKKTGKRVSIDSRFRPSKKKPDMWMRGKKVGVIVISGVIAEGKSKKIPGIGFEKTGAETVVKLLNHVRKNPEIGAVVLRVNSGGGSTIASEKIWHAVGKLAKKKVVIASFGGVAASAAYYLSSSATEIFAQPSTITGSIGIFAGKADISRLLKKVGISIKPIKEGGEKVDMMEIYRPYSEGEIEFMKKQLNHYYNIFLDRVAKGRKMEKEKVDSIGQGRIWSGKRAVEIGLVDRIGGFLSAVKRAKALAGLPKWAPVVVLNKKPETLIERLIKSSFGKVKTLPGSESFMSIASEIAGVDGTVGSFMLGYMLMKEEGQPLAMTELYFSW